MQEGGEGHLGGGQQVKQPTDFVFCLLLVSLSELAQIALQSSKAASLQAVAALTKSPPALQAVLFAFENFARRMVHQFPTNPTAQVCLGLMLRRRACHDGTRPVPQALRRQIENVSAGFSRLPARPCVLYFHSTSAASKLAICKLTGLMVVARAPSFEFRLSTPLVACIPCWSAAAEAGNGGRQQQ